MQFRIIGSIFFFFRIFSNVYLELYRGFKGKDLRSGLFYFSGKKMLMVFKEKEGGKYSENSSVQLRGGKRSRVQVSEIIPRERCSSCVTLCPQIEIVFLCESPAPIFTRKADEKKRFEKKKNLWKSELIPINPPPPIFSRQFSRTCSCRFSPKKKEKRNKKVTAKKRKKTGTQ